MRISDWSSDVCSSDLNDRGAARRWPLAGTARPRRAGTVRRIHRFERAARPDQPRCDVRGHRRTRAEEKLAPRQSLDGASAPVSATWVRSEEHTSELQSLMRISYAVFCLKKTN